MNGYAWTPFYLFSISLIFNCFKYFGVLPLTMKLPRRPKTGIEIRFSRTGFVITVVFLIATTVHAVWGPQMHGNLGNSIMNNITRHRFVMGCNHSTYSNVVTAHAKIAMLTKVLYPLLGSITSITARLMTLFKIIHSLPVVLNVIGRVDYLLFPFSNEQYPENFKGLLVLLLTAIFTHIPILVAHSWHVANFINLKAKVWQAFSMLNVWTAFLTDLQFILLCWSVQCRFVRINHSIKWYVSQELKVNDNWQFSGGFLSGWNKFWKRRKQKIMFENSQINSKVFITFIDSNKLPKANLKKIFGNKVEFRDPKLTTTNFFKSLRISHILLHDALERTNDTYQIYLLVSILSSIAKVLLNIYYIIFGYITVKSEEALNRGMPLIIIWCTYFSFRFFVLVVFAQCATNSSRLAESLLLKIDWRNFEIICQREIKMFFHHLSRRNFEFSACGLFNLNTSLISTSFSTAVTYVVIMAQLH